MKFVLLLHGILLLFKFRYSVAVKYCPYYFPRGKLYDLSCDSWSNELDEDIRQKMARMTTSAAWGLGKTTTEIILYVLSTVL